MCTPGFSGDSCEVDVCESARCTTHGKCTARYLGGDLPPVRDVCLCESPYAGPACEINPCASRTCSGHGTCYSHGEMDSYCECHAGYSGANCESSEYPSSISFYFKLIFFFFKVVMISAPEMMESIHTCAAQHKMRRRFATEREDVGTRLTFLN